jgi:radical SAM superfamily enzyme YgiQ (UPF0313 family)
MDSFNIELIANVDDAADWQGFTQGIEGLFPEGQIAKVLFVQPPDIHAEAFSSEHASSRRYFNYPPYGLGLLATVLRKLGIQVEILNLNNLVLQAAREIDLFDFDSFVESLLDESLKRLDPDLVGVSCMFSVTSKSTQAVVRQIRHLHNSVPIALGGVHISNSFSAPLTRQALLTEFPDVDLIFLNEADISLDEFVGAVRGERDVKELRGIALVEDDGNAIYLPGNAKPTEDEINLIPAHDLMDIRQLSKSGGIGQFEMLLPKNTVVSSAISNRGCRASCTFCSVRSFNGKGVRARSVKSLVDELKSLRDDHGVEHVMWLDDDFFYDRKRKLELFDEMVRQQLGLTWDLTNGVIASSCTEDLISGAAAAGCTGLVIGVESGNPEILRKIRKPGTVDTFRKCAEVLHRHESINYRVNLMIGFPDETYAMISDTIRLAQEMNLDWYHTHDLQLLPNTEIFDTERGKANPDFDSMTLIGSSFNQQQGITSEAGDVLGVDFLGVFDNVDPDAVPDRAELTRIWAYMMYTLNYQPLQSAGSPVKMKQMLGYVSRLARSVVPRSAIAWYHYGMLQKHIEGRASADVVNRTRELVDASPVWQQNFARLGLRMESLLGTDK